MGYRRSFLLGVSAAVIGAAIAGSAMAQETSAVIHGTVTGPNGEPAAGVSVTITHVPSGTVSRTTTNAAGVFDAVGLRVGGPYTVELSSPGYEGVKVTDIYLKLASPYQLALNLKSTATAAQTIVVTASRTGAKTLSTGPSSNFNSADINSLPSVSRDLKDVIRLDPTIVIDSSNSDAIQIAGTNPRMNSLTIDGVPQQDDFGLNNNGYPTQYPPISLFWIDQLNVQTAPYDVTYSGFEGGNINAVTRSGTNEFHGQGYGFYTDAGLTGHTNQANHYAFNFTNKSWGGWLSGPIIKDRVFFFLGYERTEVTQPLASYGPADSAAANKIPGTSLANVQQIQTIANGYGFTPGSFDASVPLFDEKYIAKIDANITDRQRVSLTYNHDEGNQVSHSSNISVPNQYFDLSSDWYTNFEKIDAASGQIFSDWTDNFSTEVEVSHKRVTDAQTPLDGLDAGQIRVYVAGGAGPSIFLGPDQFRHANSLANTVWQYKVLGNYTWGSHKFTAGWERKDLSVYDLFVSNSLGVYTYNSISDFQNNIISGLSYSNTPGAAIDPDPAAAAFKYSIDSFFLQDLFTLTPDLTVEAGLRYERYTTGDIPDLNTRFASAYGFPNTATLDGRDAILPRIGFNYKPFERTVVRGGLGLFTGGQPNVWFGDEYGSNDGVAASSITLTPAQLTTALGMGLNPTSFVKKDAAAQYVQSLLPVGTGAVAGALDPNFQIPTTWKASVGVDHTFDLGSFGSDYLFSFDMLFTKVDEAAFVKDLSITKTGVLAPDGRPLYAPGAVKDFLLTNTDKGGGRVISVNFQKNWDFDDSSSLFTRWGYANEDLTDNGALTSSILESDYKYEAVDDPNNPKEATSDYETTHRFTMATTYSQEWFQGFKSSVTLTGEYRSGLPYSYTFRNTGDPFGEHEQAYNRSLFYVPTDADIIESASSTAVGGTVRLSGITTAAFEQMLQQTGLAQYKGGIAPANAFHSPWLSLFNLKFEQEVPGLFNGNRGVFSVNIYNVGNMINNHWGRYDTQNFPAVAPIATLGAIESNNAGGTRYVITGLPGRPAFANYQLNSVWQLKLGLRYEF